MTTKKREICAASQLAVNPAVEADDAALSAIGDEPHFAALAGFETHRGAGRDVKPIAPRLLAIESERGVRFVEMVMRADLDRAVARVGDGQGHRRAAGVYLDIARCGYELAGDHRTLSGSARGL